MIRAQLVRNNEDCIIGEIEGFTIVKEPGSENDNEYALLGMNFEYSVEEVTLNKMQYKKLLDLDLLNVQAMKINVNEEDFVQSIKLYYLNKVETV